MAFLQNRDVLEEVTLNAVLNEMKQIIQVISEDNFRLHFDAPNFYSHLWRPEKKDK